MPRIGGFEARVLKIFSKVSFFKSINDWRPKPPFYYGWLILVMSALGSYAASGVAQIVLGGIQSLIFEDLNWNRSTIAFAVTAGTWTGGVITPLIGRLTDRYGPRPLMPSAALITGAAFFALSGVHSVWQFYAAYIIARAIANPNLVGVVPRTTTVNFFQRQRNLALGLNSMARPVSGAINIQLISVIAAAFSWRVAYQFLGIFALLLVIPLYLVMRRRPEDIGLHPDGDSRPLPRDVQRAQTSSRPERPVTYEREFSWRAGEAALTSTFWLIVATEAIVTLTSGSLSFQFVPYLKDTGFSLTVAAAALSISSLFGAMVNPGWGFLSDKFSPRKLALVALGITFVTTVLFLLTSGSGWPAFIVIIAWGTTSGGLNILGSMMLAEYFGRGSYGSILGLMGPIQTGALGLGPTVGALLFNVTGGYNSLFLYSAIGYLIAIALIYSARAPKLPQRAFAEGFTADD